jgi:hypothetical protein
VRHISDIDDPTWHDLFDREAEIRKLRQEIEELKADLTERAGRIKVLEVEVARKTALLGVP